MAAPVGLPSIDGYVVSMAKRNSERKNKLFLGSFQYITPPGKHFDLSSNTAEDLTLNLRLTVQSEQVVSAISTWHTNDSAIQVDQMTEACLDWISRKDAPYLLSRPAPTSNPNEMRGSHVAWASREGYRTINDFTAMQAVLHVAAVQAGDTVKESYLGLRESYDQLKKAFHEAQINFREISAGTESSEEPGGKDAETEVTNSVEELRQAVADETKDSVLQWQKSMVRLAADLAATFSQRELAGSSSD